MFSGPWGGGGGTAGRGSATIPAKPNIMASATAPFGACSTEPHTTCIITTSAGVACFTAGQVVGWLFDSSFVHEWANPRLATGITLSRLNRNSDMIRSTRFAGVALLSKPSLLGRKRRQRAQNCRLMDLRRESWVPDVFCHGRRSSSLFGLVPPDGVQAGPCMPGRRGSHVGATSGIEVYMPLPCLRQA